MSQSKQPLSLPPIAMKNSCKSVVLRSNLKLAIVDDIKSNASANLVELKLHPELTKYVCCVIENSINNNKKKKIDKKSLAVDILAEVFTLTAADKETVSKQIDYLVINGLIKKKTMKLIVKGLIKTVGTVLNVI